MSQDLPAAANPSPGNELPPIPGDWEERVIAFGARSLTIRLPRKPDLFLDDPDVIAANRRNDYMPYWSYLWPAAPPMAQALELAPWPTGSRVLELGAGIGLVGLAAMLRGDQVVFSDYDATSLKLCQFNARLSGLPEPPILLMDWRHPLAGPRFPVIIGCEVTYDENQHEPLLNVIDLLLEPGGVCWLGDPGRYKAPQFHQRALHRGYQVRIIDERGIEYRSPRENAFQILELRSAMGRPAGR